MFLEHSGLYWLIIGVALALLELVVPGVVLVFFGFGALVVAVVATFFPQLAIFWQLFSPLPKRTASGSRERISPTPPPVTGRL